MQDTERTERVEIDLTPTTTPSWVAQVQMPVPVELPPTPTPRGKRLARGTMPPRLSRLPLIPRPLPSIYDLPARPIPPPRLWGRTVRVDLSGTPIVRIPAAPRRRLSPFPFAATLLAAIATLVAVQGTATDRPPAAAPVAVQGTATDRAPAEPTITPILAPGEGLLAIAATQPCRIVIDGHDTGLVTPQRELRLPAGRHRVTLFDDVNGLEDHSEVVIGAAPTTLTRDLSAFVR